jgi:hypothetical protein
MRPLTVQLASEFAAGGARSFHRISKPLQTGKSLWKDHGEHHGTNAASLMPAVVRSDPGQQMDMKRMIKFTGITCVAGLALTQTLQATSITGSIGFSGVGVTYNSGSAGTATAVTSWISPVVSGVSGTFATPSPFAVANSTPVIFAPGNWNFDTTSSINHFWSVGGFTFELLSSYVVAQGGINGVNAYIIAAGTGIVSGNGYAPTTWVWSFSSQDPSSGANPTSWTFSASSSAPVSVPDGGATVLLLGIALCGVGLFKKSLAD